MEDLLEKEEEKQETSKSKRTNKMVSILIEEDGPITSEVIAGLKAKFFSKIGESSGKVFEISKYRLHDRINKIKSVDHVGYKLLEIPVEKFEFDVIGGQPFAIVNEGTHIPLFNTKLSGKDDNWVFYNKEDAVNKWTKLMNLSLETVAEAREKVEEALQDLRDAEDYVKDAIENQTW